MKCSLILIFMLHYLNVFGILSEDVIKLYNFFKWELPKDNRECSGNGIRIYFSEDDQYITDM